MTADVRSRWMDARVTHGGYSNGRESPEHYTWRSMRSRCSRPTDASYKYYGARGIAVCDRWQVFENFLLDMGERPSAEHSLDRIDVDGGYTPENCVWATRSEQQRNKRSTRFYFNGYGVYTLVEAAALVGISKALAYIRFSAWGTFDKAQTWLELQRAP